MVLMNAPRDLFALDCREFVPIPALGPQLLLLLTEYPWPKASGEGRNDDGRIVGDERKPLDYLPADNPARKRGEGDGSR